MTSATHISSNPLTFNESWLSHIGSRIYRLAIQTIESLSNTFSYPLVQPYSGKRLYQLVDTFCHSVSQSEPYNKARMRYAGDLVNALEKDRNIFEKVKHVRTILQTHILGLSTLHNKDKQSLCDHVGYTVLPSLLNGFGEQMANRALLALDKWDDPSEKNLHQYADLYRDLTLQQSEIDSFVKALQELNGNVPRELLIHEMILSRNKHLSHTAIAKITEILQDGHYIQVKLQRRLQLIQQLQGQTEAIEMDEKEITQEIKTHRDTQVEVLHYKNPSMFFPSQSPTDKNFQAPNDSALIDDESGEEFEDAQEFLETTSSPSRVEQPTVETITTGWAQPIESPEMPVGIANTNQNCWYNAALQLLNNTFLCYEIFQKNHEFSTNFPNIYQSVSLYRDTYWEQADIKRLDHPTRYGTSQEVVQEMEKYLEKDSELLKKVRLYRDTKNLPPLFLTSHMQKIRSEIHNKIDPQFKRWGASQEDSKNFLFNLLEKLSIDVARSTTLADELHTLTNKYVFLDKHASHVVDLEELFFATHYRPEAIIIHSGTDQGGHYYAAVRHNQSWYLCDDSFVQKISAERLQWEVQHNSAFIMAVRCDNDVDSGIASEA